MRPTTSAPVSVLLAEAPNRTNPPSLAIGLILMLAGTAYPRLLTDSTGRADHALALLVFWAMTAGFVRGVGFIPRSAALRWAFSGWASLASLGAAALIRIVQ